MSIQLQTSAGFKLQVGGSYVDLSDHVVALTINKAFDELDVTAMGATGHSFVAGLESSTVSVDLLNDTAAASVLATLNSLVGTNAAFKAMQVVVPGSPSTGTPSATNLLYSGVLLINKITPIIGKVGDVQVQSLTFTVSGSVTSASTGTW